MADFLLKGAVFSILICEFYHSMAARMLIVGWSCSAWKLFVMRPFNSTSVLVLLGMNWHKCAAIIHGADKDIAHVTSCVE